MNVTGRGRGGRSALRARARSPLAHMSPIKNVGSTLVGNWPVSNSGGIAADVFLELWFPVQLRGFFGLPISVPAGGTANIVVAGTVTLAAGVYAGEAHVKSWPSPLGGLEGILLGGNHLFTLTVVSIEPILGPLDLFFAPAVNWIGNPLQATWLIEIATFYTTETNNIDIRVEGEWVIFSVASLFGVTNLGLTPSIQGLNA